MKLPLPYEHKGIVVTDIDLKRVTAETVAETVRISQADPYLGMARMVSGGTAAIGSETQKITEVQGIIDAVREMPFCDVNFAVIHVLLEMNVPDAIDEASTCPKCGNVVAPDQDNPDTVSGLAVNTSETTEVIARTLAYPVEIKNAKGEQLELIEDVEIRFPTIHDCSRAARKVQRSNPGGLQLEILANAMTKGNGDEIDESWRARFAQILFRRLDPLDLADINRQTRLYGIEETVPKVCPKCEASWNEVVDLSGFFVSGLRALLG